MEVYLTAILVYVGLFLLLYPFYNCLGSLLGPMHSLGEYLGLFIAKAFAGRYMSYRFILIKEYLWPVSIE